MIEDYLKAVPVSVFSEMIVRGSKEIELFMNCLLVCDMSIKIIPTDGGFYFGIEENNNIVEVPVEYEDGTTGVEYVPKFTAIADVTYSYVQNKDTHEFVFERLTHKFKKFEDDIKKKAESVAVSIAKEKEQAEIESQKELAELEAQAAEIAKRIEAKKLKELAA